MKYILIGIALIIIFQFFWRNHWRRPFSKGLLKIDKKDYKSALAEFDKAHKKNRKNWQIDFYKGVCCKGLSTNSNFSNETKLSWKQNAISSFLWASEKNPNQEQSIEQIENIIKTETGENNKNSLITHLKKELKSMHNSAFTTTNLEKKFKWIENV